MNYKLWITLYIGILISCSSPKKSFEKGNYEKSFSSALKKVKNRKASSTEKRILMESLRNIVANNLAEIKLLEQSKNPKELKQALKLIDDTQKKINQVKRYTSIAFDEDLLELDDKEAEITEVLFDHFYQNGLYHLQLSKSQNRKRPAQDAFLDFEEAEKYQQSRKLDSLKNDALERAILNYRVHASAPFAMSFEWEIERIFENIENESSQFVDVDYDRFGSDADCEIEIEFRDLEIIEDRRITNRNDFEEEVVLRYESVTDTSGTRQVPIYGTVYASVTTIEYVKSAFTDVYIDVNSNSRDCELSGNSFSRRIDAIVEENEISGDDRAVPARFRTNETRNDLPRDNQLIEDLVIEIYEEFVRAYF